MTKTFWDGKGELDDTTQVFFTRQDGQLVGRPYLRERAKRYLMATWHYAPDRRERVRYTLANTVDNDAWLRARNCQLVTTVCRDAAQAWYGLP